VSHRGFKAEGCSQCSSCEREPGSVPIGPGDVLAPALEMWVMWCGTPTILPNHKLVAEEEHC
jgi:hypothetical protein